MNRCARSRRRRSIARRGRHRARSSRAQTCSAVGMSRRPCFIHPIQSAGVGKRHPHRTFYKVDGAPAFTLGDGRSVHSGGGLPFIFDLESGERRQPLRTWPIHPPAGCPAQRRSDHPGGAAGMCLPVLTVASRKPAAPRLSGRRREADTRDAYVVEMAALPSAGWRPFRSGKRCVCALPRSAP
jgi:hypothetical protein